MAPILDRIDLQLTMQEVGMKTLNLRKVGKTKVLDSEPHRFDGRK